MTGPAVVVPEVDPAEEARPWDEHDRNAAAAAVTASEALTGQFKKGWKTSEFWSALGASGAAFANFVFDWGLTAEEIIASVLAIGVFYPVVRGGNKMSRAKALSETLNRW